ncbi:TetR/AcrR family transcriptional regulator [Aliidiomarina minuta]|uniref:TetR/AcrR family transcriptional regulator n=1 Tax=Aliidiomarina minuta TaxID=880057 RepID=UPI00130031D1|nr:TetR/AcrR family transcriptional regulator [Aliidiomarina minuta]
MHKPAEERQHEILEAAAKIFSKCGYQAADMQVIADKAGVGKGTVYRYFPSKEELFKSVLHEKLDMLRCIMEKAHDAETDPLARLRLVMKAHMCFFEDNPEVLELFAQERAEFRDKTQSVYFMRVSENRDDWLHLFSDIKAAYPVRDISVEDMRDVCADLMHGAVILHDLPFNKKSSSESLEVIFDFYVQGILQHK